MIRLSLAFMPLLEIQNLAKTYRQMGGETTVAIGEISCKVETGEFVSFVGPSGCGKTTLLMSIAGLIAPSAGQVVIHGKEVSGPPPNLVLVFQDFNKSLFAWRSVLGNVRFGLEARGNQSREGDGKARSLIDLVGLKGFENVIIPARFGVAQDVRHKPVRPEGGPSDLESAP